MSKPKHTPGPWISGQDGIVISESGLWIAKADHPSKMLAGTNVPSKAKADKMRANAHLIAAAPELLKFLKILADRLDTDPSKEYQTILDGALKVIAEAEGKD